MGLDNRPAPIEAAETFEELDEESDQKLDDPDLTDNLYPDEPDEVDLSGMDRSEFDDKSELLNQKSALQPAQSVTYTQAVQFILDCSDRDWEYEEWCKEEDKKQFLYEKLKVERYEEEPK
jgi:hypothetical protein